MVRIAQSLFISILKVFSKKYDNIKNIITSIIVSSRSLETSGRTEYSEGPSSKSFRPTYGKPAHGWEPNTFYHLENQGWLITALPELASLYSGVAINSMADHLTKFMLNRMDFKIKLIQLIVVRHGKSQANENDVLQGQANAPLCETGEKQAELAAKALQDAVIDAAYSSDLDRAVQTAKLILSVNRSWNSNLRLIEDKLIRDRSFGVMENINEKEYNRIAKEKGFHDWYQFTPEGGESPQQVRKRVKEFITQLYEKREKIVSMKTWNVLVVSHNGWIRELARYLMDELECTGVPLDRFGYPPFCPNTGISRYEIILPNKEEESSSPSANCIVFQDINHLKLILQS